MKTKSSTTFSRRPGRASLWLRAGCAVVVLCCFASRVVAQAMPELLSSEERAWLAAHGPLRYAPDPAFPPFEFIQPDGRVAGITPDMLTILAQRLGTTIQPVRYGTWAEVMEGMERGEADLLGTLTRTAERERFLLFTKPYLDVVTAVFVRRAERDVRGIGDLAGRRVGVVQDHGAHAWLKKHHPEVGIVPVASVREGLLMVALDRLDAQVEALPVGQHVIAENALFDIRVLPEALYSTPQHLAVAANNPRLLGILQKGLDSLTEAEHQQIRRKWAVLGPVTVPWRAPRWLWWAAAAVVSGSTMVLARNWWLRRRVAQQEDVLRATLEKEADLERRCAELIENATDMVFTRDLDGNYTSINPAGERILGYSREELLRMNVSQVVVSEHLNRVQQQMQKVAAQDSATYEVQVRAKDGRIVWLETSMRALFKDGRRVGVQGIAREITERKRAEQQVRESELLYHSLVEQLPQAIFRLDRSGRITFVNSRYCQMIGRTKEQLLGRTDFDLFPRELAEKYWADDRKVMETGSALETVDHVRMPDGREMFVQVLKSPLRDASGQIAGIQCLFWDVTGHKQAQDAIVTERHLLRALIDNLPDLIFTKDAEGRYVISNAAHLRYLGVAKESDLAGRTVFDMNPPELARGYHEDDLRVLRGGEIISNREELVRDHAGNLRWFLTTKVPLRNREGRVTGLVAVCRNIDERKRAEEALRQSEETFSAVFQSSPTPMSLSTVRDGKIARVNARFLALTGYREAEVVGRTSLELGIWADPEEQNRFWAQAQQTGRVVNAASELRTKSGEVRHGLSSAEILTIGGEKYLLGIFNDITERKRAEDELKRSHSLLHGVIESTIDGILVVGLDGKVQSFNKRFLELWRIPEDLAAKGDDKELLQFVLDQLKDPAGFLAKVEELYRSTGASSMDEIQFRDGRVFERYSQPQRLGDMIVGRVWSFRDITQRRLAEQAVRESEERYRLLAEHSEDFVSLHDAQGNRLYVSPSYYRVTGWTPEEISHTDWRGRMHPDDLDKVERAWAANRRGEANTIEHRIRCKDGSWIWVESLRKPILGPDHKVQQIVLWAHDITERKKAEEARAQLESQLRQAQKMEAVGQLAGGIAHDFNNILTVILGNAHLLEGETGLPPAACDKVQQLIKSADRAAALTRQLLAFSRRQVMQTRRLDLNEVLSNVTQMLGHLIGEHILLQCSYAPALPQVEADAGMMEQVIVNLAVNARDAMPHGGRLTIGTHLETITPEQARQNADARPGQYVTLTVTDTGCGMDEETRSHLFEPFFTTKEVGKGTGLGLAMTYGIVKQHNGWIEAASRINQGTTFKLFLPACPTGAAAAPQPAASAPAETDCGCETILVVEDEEPVRQFIRDCLEKRGYRVLIAASGADAVRVWESAGGNVDLLLTDIVMPGGMSGRELAARLRKAQPGLKVILSSGYSREIAAQTGDFPAWLCLPKPYDPATLALTVRRCLDTPQEGL